MSQQAQFTIDDALALRPPSPPAWNDDGTRVSYPQLTDGETILVTQQVEEFDTTDLSMTDTDNNGEQLVGDVSDHAWRPSHPETVAAIHNGDIVLFDAATGDSESLITSNGEHSSLAWHPDGRILGYVRDGSLWLHDVETGETREIDNGIAGPIKWNDEGTHLATLTEGTETSALTVYTFDCDDGIPDIKSQLSGLSTDHPRDDPLVAWEQVPTPGDALIGNQFVWAGDYLVYLEEIDGIDRTYRAVNPATTDLGSLGSPILTEHDERGLSFPSIVGHKNDKVAVTAAPNGHFHIFVVDIPTRVETIDIADPGFGGTGILEVTSGLFEARGDIEEDPAWNSSGNRLAYVTNEKDVGERHLTVATIENNAVTEKICFDDISGTTIHPTWGDERIACLRAGRTDPTGVHVFDVATNAVKRVSTGHETPETLSWFPDPEPVSFENSHDGNTVYGYLYTPPTASSGDDRPAVVWVHGGPARQMRRGFHHKPAYGLFHIFNHLLIDRGYVVLEVNFRRGIGYGRDFQTSAHYDIGNSDVQDCADAATFLRDHDMVGDTVGLWGISYGGYMANAVATKTDAYDCAINIAGLWDWRDWVRNVTEVTWDARVYGPLFGGHPDDPDPDVEQRYHDASPCDHIEGLDIPLFALHGTDDASVPFNQMDRLVTEIVEHGADFEMAYYPNENHLFEKPATWHDSLGRILTFFNKHLQS